MGLTSDSITALMAKTFTLGLTPFRKRLVMPGLVNTDYNTDIARQGTVVTVPFYSSVTTTAVVPGETHPAAPEQTETIKEIRLTEWQKSMISVDDQELIQIYNSTTDYLPKKVTNMFTALADELNTFILTSMYKEVYNFYSEAAFNATHIVPFVSNGNSAVEVRSRLNRNHVEENLQIVLSQAAEDNALKLAEFKDINYGIGAFRTGNVPGVYGFSWNKQQGLPIHTAGTASAAADITTTGTYAAGVKTVSMTKGTGSATVVVGDVFTIAGDDQTYVVTAAQTITTGGVSVAFEPGLVNAISSGTPAVTFTKSHRVMLGFSPEAYTVVYRTPGGSSQFVPGAVELPIQDSQTGIPMRMKIWPEHYQTKWAIDILYGGKTLRPEAACRLASLASLSG